MKLPEQMTQAFHSLDIEATDQERMTAVLAVVSEEVRHWAPAVEQARICNLAINEVADRMLRECEA
jgi:hypothetical protein